MNRFLQKFAAILLVALILLPTAIALADEGTPVPKISAGNVTAKAGQSVYVYVTGENFSNLAAMELSLFYDAENLHLISASANSAIGKYNDVNTAESGVVKLALGNTTGLTGNCTMLTLCFSVDSNAEAKKYPLTVTVGDALNTDRQSVSVARSSGSITVQESTATVPTINLNLRTSRSTLEKDDIVTVTAYSNNTQQMAAGEFEFFYDDTLLDFSDFKLYSALEAKDATYSVNSEKKGYVKLTFASPTPVSTGDWFQVGLKATVDIDASTAISFVASKLLSANLTAINGKSQDISLTLKKQEVKPETPDYPDLWLEVPESIYGKEPFDVTVWLSGKGNVAAGDFTISFDTTKFTCNAVPVAAPGLKTGSVTINKTTYSAGQVKFSFLYADGAQEDQPLVTFRLTPLICESVSTLTTAGKNVCDPQLKLVSLDFLSEELTTQHVTVTDDALEATYFETGLTEGSHCSACGKVLAAQQTTPQKICTCDLDGDKEITNQDLATLAKHVSGIAVLKDNTLQELTDINGDGDTNSVDLTILAKILLQEKK